MQIEVVQKFETQINTLVSSIDWNPSTLQQICRWVKLVHCSVTWRTSRLYTCGMIKAQIYEHSITLVPKIEWEFMQPCETVLLCVVKGFDFNDKLCRHTYLRKLCFALNQTHFAINDRVLFKHCQQSALQCYGIFKAPSLHSNELHRFYGKVNWSDDKNCVQPSNHKAYIWLINETQILNAIESTAL